MSRRGASVTESPDYGRRADIVLVIAIPIVGCVALLAVFD